MATKKISEFTTLGSLSDNDILPVVSGGANKKVTASVLKTYAQTGIDTGNITFSGDQISSTGEGVDVTSTGYAQLSSNSNYVWVDNTGINIEVSTGEGGNVFLFQHDNGTSKLKLPAGGDIVDSSGNSVLGGGASTGDITFDGVQIIGAETTRGGGSIELVPNNSTEYVTAGQYINIYPTNAQDAPHIHVAAGAGGDLILGDDNYNVDVNHNGYVRVTAHDSADSITYQWRFNNDGQFQLPYNGSVQQNGSYTRTTNSWFTNSTDNSGIVWTALYNDVGSVKLTIQAQSLEVGGDEGLHYQVCEAIVASRGRSIEVGYGEPVMTVYGVTHTSTAPLATFSVQRNPVSKLIEIVATRTSATTTGIDFRIHSVEMIAID
jgi:hypothetical protein